MSEKKTNTKSGDGSYVTAVIEYTPLKESTPIKLAVATVKKMFAQPTRSGAMPTDEDCWKFIKLCQSRGLNPYLGDAWLLGYDSQNGAHFDLITSQQALLKRADNHASYKGMDSGIIVATVLPPEQQEDGKFYPSIFCSHYEGTVQFDPNSVQEIDGDLWWDGQVVLGGWAKVYREDRSQTSYERIKREVFDTGRSRWLKDFAGMICKVAESHALRMAFPNETGGLYTLDEGRQHDANESKDRPAAIGDGTSDADSEATPGKPEKIEPYEDDGEILAEFEVTDTEPKKKQPKKKQPKKKQAEPENEPEAENEPDTTPESDGDAENAEPEATEPEPESDPETGDSEPEGYSPDFTEDEQERIDEIERICNGAKSPKDLVDYANALNTSLEGNDEYGDEFWDLASRMIKAKVNELKAG